MGNTVRCAEVRKDLCALSFGESSKWGDIDSAVAELGEESCDRLGRVVGADDQ
ncbi:Uncharacterised protein [Mycobacteroides abscessus subsp. abscessus]|nr:Uncharacterised protein [Mycobacteroides abscessus subsp. abscessus]